MESEELFSANKLVAWEEFLSNFIEVYPHPMYIKDAKTGKYLLTNQATLEIYGLKSVEDLIGLTPDDLDYFTQSHWGNMYAKLIEKLDNQAKTSKRWVKSESVILTNAGFIRVEEIINIPVMNVNHKVTAVFTLSYDLTSEIDFFRLFKFYKRYYPKKKAIKPFLKYLNIDQFFVKDPTEAEILILLAMRSNDSYKYVASQLNIEPKTVETHRSRLRRKLKDVNLSRLLVHMRNICYESKH